MVDESKIWQKIQKYVNDDDDFISWFELHDFSQYTDFSYNENGLLLFVNDVIYYVDFNFCTMSKYIIDKSFETLILY